MKLIKYFFCYPISLIFFSCQGTTKDIQLSDFKFESVFGTNSKDSFQTYCLLGTGFFRAPFSKNADSLISGWMKNHPNAKVIPISTLDEPKHKMTYCWLVDKGDTINNYMIKNGCYPGGTMMRPQTYEEMSDKMKAVYNDIEKPNVKVHIDKKVYDNFIEQIKAAETFAHTNKLGIWNKKKDDE
jgi:hypothetical protein